MKLTIGYPGESFDIELLPNGGGSFARRSRVKPTLFVGDGNKVYAELRLGQFTATIPLPEAMAGYTEEQLKPFFDKVIPEMTQNLISMRATEQRKLRKKACRSGSTVSSRSSAEKILCALPKP